MIKTSENQANNKGFLMEEVEDIEMDLLMKAIFKKYGYNFRDYSSPSLTRRINSYLIKSKYRYISEIIPDILRDESLFDDFLNNISVSVTEMFRNPGVYRKIREVVIPHLYSFPRLNIWHAGCATGEEVYSFAIMLKEEGLYDRANIYATDIDVKSLKIAKDGIYHVDSIKKGTDNYKKSGGKCSFSDYYHARYGKAIIDSSLKKNITFSTHNLAVDMVFNEMHLVVCRNVLIYFNKKLQDHVLELMSSSLVHNGFLTLGIKEQITFSSINNDFQELSKKHRIFRKTGFSGDRFSEENL